MIARPCIVILGAGFGGLRAAILLSKKLRGQECDVVLIDRNDYQTYTPTLYEAATTAKETADYLKIKEIVTFPIANLLKNTGVRFLKSEVEKLDLVGGDIHLKTGGRLKFNYLVLAPGSETNYFDIPGLKENALPLKTFLDAVRIRDKILEFVYSGQKSVKIIIGGGGSTGVELAGELKEWLCEIEEQGYSCAAEVKLIEGSPSLLPGFDERIIRKVSRRLKNLGAQVLINEIIASADSSKIILKSGKELTYDVLIWTGGVKASSLVAPLPLKIERRGRMEVGSNMECLPQTPDLKLYGKIYGIGDAICFYDPRSGKPMPGVARAALIQAEVVAHNISADIKGGRRHKTYRPMNYPYVVPVGGKWAVAKLGPIIIWGFCGWILKGLVELNYLLSIMPLFKAIRLWLKGLWIFIKNDRLG